VDAALMDAAGPSLRVVALASMGFDNVDRDAAAERGIVVTHTPRVLAETTADLTFALILAARRRLGAAREPRGRVLGPVPDARLSRPGRPRSHPRPDRLRPDRPRGGPPAHGFGMRVIHHDPYAPDDDLSTSVDLATLLADSDVVSLHVPLTPETRHLISARELAAMKPTATLVSTSRGGVVDEDALLDALRDGSMHSAGLDVFEREPMGTELSPLVAEPHAVTLPHIGSATEATRAAMVDLAVDNIQDVLAGGPARTPIPGGAATPGQDRAPRPAGPGDAGGAITRVNDVSSTPRMSAPARSVASFTAAWNTGGPGHHAPLVVQDVLPPGSRNHTPRRSRSSCAENPSRYLRRVVSVNA
jgi:phosphoglycerate dehydrogenase-like enzyme